MIVLSDGGATNFLPVCCAHSPFGGNLDHSHWGANTTDLFILFIFLHFNFQSSNLLVFIMICLILLLTMSGKENDCNNDQEDSFVRCRWKETCLPSNREPNQSTHRIALQFISGKHLECQLLLCFFTKIPFLNGAVG